LQRIPDFQQATLTVLPPLMIPEPKCFNILLRQKSFTNFIMVNSFGQTMLKAVKFNGQLRIGAVEIQNMSANGMLPAKFETGELSSSQCAPQFFLVFGLMTAKLTGKLFEAPAVRMRMIIEISSSSPRPSPRLAKRGRRNTVNFFAFIYPIVPQSFFSSMLAS
jgi:hypothetical protein